MADVVLFTLKDSGL